MRLCWNRQEDLLAILARERPFVCGFVLIEFLRPYGAKSLYEARGLFGVEIDHGQE
jgi:hypothetical protein